jgi:hypothetical protein
MGRSDYLDTPIGPLKRPLPDDDENDKPQVAGPSKKVKDEAGDAIPTDGEKSEKAAEKSRSKPAKRNASPPRPP